jgi:hypothetical protein
MLLQTVDLLLILWENTWLAVKVVRTLASTKAPDAHRKGTRGKKRGEASMTKKAATPGVIPGSTRIFA